VSARVSAADVGRIVFACDAGMGSSVVGASQLRKELAAAGLKVPVEHVTLRAIPRDARLVFCHEGLAAQARASAPWAVVIALGSFLGDPAYRRVAHALEVGADIEAD
jgi:mannitol-specific phosphotransferase system IIBC component